MSAPTVELVQAFELAGVLALFDLDFTPVWAGLPVLHFVSDHARGFNVVRGGVLYYPVPIEDHGFARGGEGAPPQPEIAIGDALQVVAPWVWSAQDLVGAELTRTLVLRAHLDDGTDPDAAEFLLMERFRVEQKTDQDPSSIRWRVVARWEQLAKELPGRVALADTCQHRYRVFVSGAFDYSKATCPYVGSALFDVVDESTATSAEDQCSKLISGCKARFPTSPLPTTAFPGLGRRR